MNIKEQLVRDEGEVLHVYLDTMGIRTAGVGHNLEAHGIDLPVGTVITKEQSDQWLTEDIAKAKAELDSHLVWSAALDDARYGVLLNMSFNMGIFKLLKFVNTLGMIRAGRYSEAATGMLQSAWATQVGPRAVRLANQMRTGAWQ